MMKFECPVCNKTMGALASVMNKENRHPKDGDICLCENCAAALTFSQHGLELKLRKLEEDDLKDVPFPIAITMLLTQKVIELFKGQARHRYN